MMADIAVVFHWPPAVMDEMEIDELTEWHGLAVERAKAMLGGGR
jgi:hypothetical protein